MEIQKLRTSVSKLINGSNIIFDQGRKGISPLIASVLLIAFTLSVAMIANPFFSNTIKDIQSGTSERADTVTRAANLGLEIMSVEFNRSSNELEVVVQNTGEAIDENTNISIGVIGGSVANTEQHNVDLGPNEITTLSVPVDRTYPLDTVQAALTGYPVSTESGIKCTPTKGLVGYWTFNEEQTKNGWLIGSSKNSYNGSLENGLSTGQNGKVGESYYFDGNNDYINLKRKIIGGRSRFSVVSWVRPDDNFTGKTGGSATVIGAYGGAGGIILPIGDTGVADFYLDGSRVVAGTSANGNWAHLTYTFDSGNASIYEKNELLESGNLPSPAPTDNDLKIGQRGDGANYFKGKIDELRIYNREISKNEIQRLYQVRSENWAIDGCKLTG